MKSLYVSRLSESTSEEELRGYFSQFGPISDLQLGKFLDGRCKGYAKLTVKDDHTYHRVLNFNHLIENKIAKIEPFIKKDEAVLDKDLQVVQRRVCVFGVPKNFNNKKFKKVFSDFFGHVENAYVRSNKTKSFNYGFVTFDSKEMVIDALRIKYLEVEGSNPGQKVQMEIKKFLSKGLKKRQKKLEKGRLLGEKDTKNYLRFYAKEGRDVKSKMELKTETNLSVPNSFSCFMEKEMLDEYLGNIIKNNEQIDVIPLNLIKTLELFYFNSVDSQQKNKRNTTYNYRSIACRFSKRIEKNHGEGNLVMNRTNPVKWSKKRRRLMSMKGQRFAGGYHVGEFDDGYRSLDHYAQVVENFAKFCFMKKKMEEF